MATEKEIEAAAQQFIERFGPNAPSEAAMRAREMGEARDQDAQNLWREIEKQVRWLLESAPSGSQIN